MNENPPERQEIIFYSNPEGDVRIEVFYPVNVLDLPFLGLSFGRETSWKLDDLGCLIHVLPLL